MFGSNDSKLGYAIENNVNEASYKYSLDTDLAAVIYDMKDEVAALGLASSFKSSCSDDEHRQVTSRLSNQTDLPLTESEVNEALNAFTAETGIPVVIVVEDAEDAFGRTQDSVDVTTVLIAIGLAVLAIVIVVFSLRKRQGGAYNEEDDDLI
jgi:uncharacterized protein YpuA (DUF1002 family)